MGAYTYGSKPHAVTQAGSNTYAYDANGNLTTGAGRSHTWDSANRMTQVRKTLTPATTCTLVQQLTGCVPTAASEAIAAFSYGPDGSRWKLVKTAPGGAVTTVRYLGAGYEEVVAGGVTERKHYIFAGGERIALYATKSSGASSLKYLHQDHLGSTDAVSDASGAVIERLSYDPHGKRRNANWTDAAGILASVSTDRGYTGHEHLDEVGLIHMNGRVYDPTLGRFLSADPTVQFPEASQSLNRYSYVLNNPLSFTDPTGYFLGGVFKAIGRAFKAVFNAIKSALKNPYVRLAIGIAAGVYGGQVIALRALGIAAKGGFAFGVVAGASGGFIGGAIIGGNLESAFMGAFAGAAFGGMAGYANTAKWGLGQEIAGQGLVGGATARVQGGSFQSGMLSAAFIQWASPLVDRIPLNGEFLARAGRVSASAVIGGTASVVGGGKFENGAKTFGFLRTVGEAADYYQRKVGYGIDMGPGGDAVGKDRVSGPPVEGANNIGTQHELVDPNCTFCEGGPVSRSANQLWGVNAVAGYHDTLQISMGNSIWRNVLNVPGMGVAAGVTYTGFIGQTLNAAGPMMMPIRDDDRRGGYQWVMYAP